MGRRAIPPSSTPARLLRPSASISAAPGANGALSLGAISFTNTTSSLQIGSSNYNGLLILNGATVNAVANVILSNTSGSQSLTIANLNSGAFGSQTMGLVLNNTTNVIVASSGSTINISTIISQTNPLSGITFQGGGTLVLSGANTYTGATNVNSGIISIASATPLASTSGINVGSGGTLQLSGSITSLATTPLTINGAGASGQNGALANASGTNNYSGLLTLSGNATIAANSGTLNLTNTGTITGAYNLTLTGAGTGTISSIIGTGAGTVTKTGAGTWTIVSTAPAGASTYTGGTTLNAGTLLVGAYGSLGTGTLTLSGGTLGANGPQITGGYNPASVPNAIVVTAGTTTFLTDSARADFTISGSISGSGSLTINSTLSDSVWISANPSGFTGTLNFVDNSAGANFRLTGNAYNWSGAAFVFSSATTGRELSWNNTAPGTVTNQIVQIGSLSGTGGIIGLGNGIAVTYQIGALNTNTTFSGLITTAQTGAISITKVGTGTLTLGGANTYVGVTTVTQGILSVSSLANGGATSNIGASTNVAANLILNGGDLQYTGATASTNRLFTLTTAGTIDGSGTGGLTFSTGTAITVTNAAALTLTGSSTANVFDPIIVNNSTGVNNTSLTMAGTGTWTLNGVNTFSGGTTVSAGTLTIGATGSIPGTVTISSGATLTLATPSTGGTLTGPTSVTSGTLQITSTGSIKGPLTVSGAAFQMSGVGAMTGPVSIANGALQFTATGSIAGATTVNGTTMAVGSAGVITGPSTLSGGTLLIASGGSITGATTVSGGTLQVASGGSITNSAAVTGGTLSIQPGSLLSSAPVAVSDPGSLLVSGITPTSATITLPSLTLGSTSGATLSFVLNGATPANPILTISNSNGLFFNGVGTTLNVTNIGTPSVGEIPLIAYTGTAISGGLTLGNLPTARTVASIDYTSVTGLIQLNVTSLNGITWTGSVNSNWDTGITSNWQINSVATTFTANDAVLFNDTASTGSVSLAVAVLPASVTFANTNTAYTVSGAGSIGGTGAVYITSGGAVTLLTANSYSGGTFLSSGQLNINASGTSPTNSAIGTGTLTIGAGTTIDNTSGFAVTLATNNAQIWSGSFIFGGSNALSMGTGAVKLGTSLTVTTNGSNSTPLTVGGVISDGGSGFSLTKAGLGTLILSGANAFSGGVAVSAGILNIQASTALGVSTAAASVASGATLQLQGGITVANPLTLNGAAQACKTAPWSIPAEPTPTAGC